MLLLNMFTKMLKHLKYLYYNFEKEDQIKKYFSTFTDLWKHYDTQKSASSNYIGVADMRCFSPFYTYSHREKKIFFKA